MATMKKDKQHPEVEEISADELSALHSAERGEQVKTEQQLYEEWLESRRGKLTASNFGKLMKNPRSKAEKEAGNLGESAKTYIKEVVAEILGAKRKELDLYQFRWGKKYEPIAIEYYEKKFGVKLEKTGSEQQCFSINEFIGATPDGIEDIDTGCEFKCPESGEKHLTHLLIQDAEELKKQKPDYYWQCVGGMLTTGKKRWKFISFHEFFQEHLKMKVITIERDECEIIELEKKLLKGKKYKDQIINQLKE